MVNKLISIIFLLSILIFVFGCVGNTLNDVENKKNGVTNTVVDNLIENDDRLLEREDEVCHLFTLEELSLSTGISDITERSTTVIKTNPNSSSYWYCHFGSSTQSGQIFSILINDYKNAIKSDDYFYDPISAFNQNFELECKDSNFYKINYCQENIVGKSYWSEYADSYGDSKILVAVVNDLVVSVKIYGNLNRLQGIELGKNIIELIKRKI